MAQRYACNGGSRALSFLISIWTGFHVPACQYMQFTSVPWQNDNFLYGRVLIRYPNP